MIESADEFRRLRTSDDHAEQQRAAHEEAPLSVWREVVGRFPDLREWVAQNKTVPHELLGELADDPDPRVRSVVAAKRRLNPAVQLQLAGDLDEGVRGRLAWNARATHAALARVAAGPAGPAAERAGARLTAGEYVE